MESIINRFTKTNISAIIVPQIDFFAKFGISDSNPYICIKKETGEDFDWRT